MIEMTNREHSEFCDDLFSKFKLGELTAEEVYEKLDSVDRVWVD